MTRIGEVVQSATTHFIAEALRAPGELAMPKAPPFGAFVKVGLQEEDRTVYGLVYHMETASLDGHHQPVALNLSRQELREQQPQVFALLRTTFAVVVTGHADADGHHAYLPPHPPMVHDFVEACSPEAVRSLTDGFEFLRTVLGFAPGPTDELVASCLRQAHRLRGGEPAFLLEASRALTNLLRNDYDRLAAILGRLED